MDLKTLDFSELEAGFQKDIEAAADEASVEGVRRTWLSKEGTIRTMMAALREVPADQKPAVAQKNQRVKGKGRVEHRNQGWFLQVSALEKMLASQWLDPSLPGKSSGVGRRHPVTEVEQKIVSLLRPFGFENVYGPEIETEYYCFDSLNIPPHHPARDMQDTFYTQDGLVLRTHTTSVQARTLQTGKLPIKIATFGRVYRNEAEDASHQAMFHQFELVWLEEGLTLAHLMGIITHILKGLYGKRRKVRFVPKFYPYTEPSIGPQIDCSMCKGSGCALCGHSGWVTVAGAGMIHRKVLLEFGYDPEKITGSHLVSAPDALRAKPRLLVTDVCCTKGTFVGSPRQILRQILRQISVNHLQKPTSRIQ